LLAVLSRTSTHYSERSFAQALKTTGVSSGDLLFIHSNVGLFGIAEGTSDSKSTCELILKAICDVIGPEGTIVVPSFTYSFGSTKEAKVFDLNRTPSSLGIFSEFIRNHPNSIRSRDPMFSTVALGKQARDLTDKLGTECFGQSSIWDKLYEAGAKSCNFNFSPGYCTFIHYAEKCLNVPYRKDRKFTGTITDGENQEFSEVTYFSNDLNTPQFAVSLDRFQDICIANGGLTKKLGRGKISTISFNSMYDLIEKELPRNPYFLTVGG
jgi:aminoglycoside 3-N-acetyltransferase